MNEIEIFKNDSFGKIRAIMHEGEPWFVATDVCKALRIVDTTRALARLDNDEKSRFNLGLAGGATNVVNEYGLYNLMLASRKAEAKEFKRWVTHEVLSSIRNHGVYMTDYTIEEIASNPDLLMKIALSLKKEQEKKKEENSKAWGLDKREPIAALH